jgi:hypothetical protein
MRFAEANRPGCTPPLAWHLGHRRRGDYVDEFQELLGSKYALPAGLGLLALLLLMIGGTTKTPALAVFGTVTAIGAFLALARIAQHSPPSVPVSTVPVPDPVRRQQLQDYLSVELAQRLGRIESVTPYTAVVVYGKPVNHVLHLLATVFLCGLWLPVWILIAVSGGETRRVLSVDVCGNVTQR